MNPLTQIRNQRLMNERELQLGYANTGTSWHALFKDSAWIYVGGLDFDLTEGDVVCVFSQYGEIVNINLVRDLKTGKSKGFAFICYEDQRSTVLATDNLNGARVVGRTLRVNHVDNYQVRELTKQQRELLDEDQVRKRLREQGCAPGVSDELTAVQRQVKRDQAAGSRSPDATPPPASDRRQRPVAVKQERIDPRYPDCSAGHSRSHGNSDRRDSRSHGNSDRFRNRSRSRSRSRSNGKRDDRRYRR